MVDYFPEARRERLFGQSVQFDPEFETFTYGDPTRPKASLQRLSEGSLLVFYAGLRGWDFDCPAGLYIIGCFEVARAGSTASFSQAELTGMFQNNFHVMHGDVFEDQKDRLVLVKGNANSRLLKTAVRISSVGTDRNGRPLHRLAPEMQKVFGGFDGNTSIQRSPPRWVAPGFTRRAERLVLALRRAGLPRFFGGGQQCATALRYICGMAVHQKSFRLTTRGNCDVIDITAQAERMVQESEIRCGIANVAGRGSTLGITTMEFESGCVADFRRALDRVAPPNSDYAHNARWGDNNGYAHLRSALVGTARSFPVRDGRLGLGPWQQLVLCDFDDAPREREVTVTIVGE